MLPLSPESLLDGRETMASVPEAINLVKSGRSDAESAAMSGQDGTTAVEENRDQPMRVVTHPREEEGSNLGSVTSVALPVTSDNDMSNRQGSKRYVFREPSQLHPRPDAEKKRVPQGIAVSKDQLIRTSVTNGVKHRAMQNGQRTETSAARSTGNDVMGVATNASRDANSDDEYIDVETFDPVEDRRQSLLELSRRVATYTRVQYQDPKVPSSTAHQQTSKKDTDTGGEHSAIDDDRVPSLDSGFYSDEEVRVRMRGSSSDWSDSFGEAYRSKDSGAGRLSSSGTVPEDADQPRSHSYQTAHAVNDDTIAFSPPQRTSSSELPARHHEVQQVTTTIPVTYVKSYGGYTVYIPGKVQSPEKETSLSTSSNVRVPDTLSGTVGRNSTAVVYTMDASAVRMSTTTSSVMDSRGLYYNAKPAAAVAQRKSVLVVTGDESSSERDLYMRNADSSVSGKSARTKSNDRSYVAALPDGRDEVSYRYLQQFSSYSPDRAVIIPIPSEKSAFVNTAPNGTDSGGIKAVATPATYLRVEGIVPETRSTSERNASDFERMGPPVETIRRYIPSTAYLPRAYVTHPYKMVAKKPVSSHVESTALHAQANGNSVYRRLDARMTPENSGEREYVYQHSNPMRIVYTPISDIADDEPPSKVARLTCGSERLLSIAEIEHESQTAARHSRYPMTEVEIVRGESQGSEGSSTDHWPLEYGSHILKSYLRGQEAVDQETLYRANSPGSRGEDSETGAERDIGPWFRGRKRAEEEVSRSYRRENTAVGIESVARGQGGSYGKQSDYYNGDASVTLDLSKKHGTSAAASEGVQFAKMQQRYSSSEGGFAPVEVRARSLADAVSSPASVIVPSGSRGAVYAGGEDRTVVRTVIVSAERSRVSGGQRLPEVGTDRPREVRTAGREVGPTTVLAPEPVGQQSRYTITRVGEGNRFVIREVGSEVKSAAGQLVAIKERIESELAGRSLPIGAVQGRRGASGAEVGGVHHPKSPVEVGGVYHPKSPAEVWGVHHPKSPVEVGGVYHPKTASEVGEFHRPKSPSEVWGVHHPKSPVEVGGVYHPKTPSEVGDFHRPKSPSEVWGVHHPKSPGDARRHPPSSVIRTAPSRDGRNRPTEEARTEEESSEVYRVRRVLPSGMPHFEPTEAERAWADAEWAASAAARARDERAVYGAAAGGADSALRLRVWAALWALLGGERLRALGWPRLAARRLLWRTVRVCCAVAGAKSPAAVPLPADHDCGADMACFRDHAHRFLEVCAPTRDHWKRYGWASLTIDAVVAKLYDEDIAPWLRTLPDAVVPEAVRSCVRQLSALQASAPASPPRATPPPSLPPPPARDAAAPAVQRPPLAPLGLGVASEDPQDARKKRGRPAKPAAKADAAGRVERVMLWRFLLNLLEDPRNEACIHWVSRDQGIFRILNTDWLARLWGRRHGNPRMTYEKMARAMRTYYRSKVLQPVPRSPNLPRKLVYKFNPAVVQRVAAANKLAQQQQEQQQQQQQQQQRIRQPRTSTQYEGDQLRALGADPRPQTRRQSQPQPLPQAQLEDRSRQALMPAQHEARFLSDKRHLGPQVYQPGDHRALEDGQRWDAHHMELQRKQVLHHPDDHRLSPEESSLVPLHQRLHQYHQPRLGLYQLRREQEPLLHDVHNNVLKEAHHQSHHDQQQKTDDHSPRPYRDSQQHQHIYRERDQHPPIRSPCDGRYLHSPVEQHNNGLTQQMCHSPSNNLHRKTEDSHLKHEEEAQQEQHEVTRSSPEGHNHNNHLKQEVSIERDSSPPHIQQN